MCSKCDIVEMQYIKVINPLERGKNEAYTWFTLSFRAIYFKITFISNEHSNFYTIIISNITSSFQNHNLKIDKLNKALILNSCPSYVNRKFIIFHNKIKEVYCSAVRSNPKILLYSNMTIETV